MVRTTIALVFMAGCAATAATLTDADRKEAVAHLERTRAGVLEATNGLSREQWSFKPGAGQWSIAEIVEHIALTEDMLLQHTKGTVMRGPAGKPDRDHKSADKLVATAIADRSKKVKAPPEVTPSGRWSPEESLDHFRTSRQHTLDYLRTEPGLRDHVADSPLGQPLDGYQWLLYISAHAERHTKQILEVKASPGFPRK